MKEGKVFHYSPQAVRPDLGKVDEEWGAVNFLAQRLNGVGVTKQLVFSAVLRCLCAAFRAVSVRIGCLCGSR
jgi:hypothetical protein